MIHYIKEKLRRNERLLNCAALLYNFIHRSTAWRYRRANQITTKGVFLRRVKFRITGSGNKITIEPRSRLTNCQFTIIGNNCSITLGNRSIINHTEFWCDDTGSSITAGAKMTIESGHIASTEGAVIIIGDDCMLAHDVEIRNGDSHSIIDTSTDKRINPASDVIIGSHVWLATHCRVLKGSNIPQNCIIGNSAVVNSKFTEQNAIYAGTPARMLKTGITWDRNRL